MQPFDHDKFKELTAEEFRIMMMKAQAMALINYFISKVVDTALTVVIVIAVCRYAGINI